MPAREESGELRRDPHPLRDLRRPRSEPIPSPPFTFLPYVQGLHGLLDGEGSLVLVAHPPPALPRHAAVLLLRELGHFGILHLPVLRGTRRGVTG